MFSRVYTDQRVFAAIIMGLFMGCATAQTSSKNTPSSGATKDCATCFRMCELAGNTEKKPNAVNVCKTDCQKSCR